MRPFLQCYKFTKKNGGISKTIFMMYLHMIYLFKPKISPIFYFELVNKGWIIAILYVLKKLWQDINLPDFSPWARTVVSKDELMICELSLLNMRQVIPLLWAFSNFRKHCPVVIFHIFTCPPSEPDASISESLEKAKQRTASSIIMKFSWAWYFKSFLIFPVVKFHT